MTAKLSAVARTEFGKGAARRLRRDNQIPAVIYSAGSEATHVALPAHAAMMALRKHTTHTILELEIEGADNVFVKAQALQVDTLRRVLEHVDFVVIEAADVAAAEASAAADEAAEDAAADAASDAAAANVNPVEAAPAE